MATRSTLTDFQTPRIVSEDADERSGRFTIEPLDRGFGYTFGNSLRRVLLSSLEGAAVTAVKIEGVAHEFTTLPGVREDVTDIILNLKSIVCVLGDDPGRLEIGHGGTGGHVILSANQGERRLAPTSSRARRSGIPAQGCRSRHARAT